MRQRDGSPEDATLISKLLILFLCVSALMVAGCCTTATHEGMTPTTFETGAKNQKTVGVDVGGGKELDELGRTRISNEEFKKALLAAITKSGTFSRTVEGKEGDYLLSVMIFSMEQPVFGLSFTVKMEAGWTLKRVATGETVWQESIKSEHTATTGDAFIGATRLRLATEGAGRKNISQGLAKISKLSL
ncbi:hypothetical protein KOM00_09420 [Geomonas sp. Red69]|uniref:Lipoprotein n=1 Tax=Geomonas diazotrophica TaxID=2843197 RepID=A0ABX8JKM2_9BACT|nr:MULTISPECIES: hypothetical protein [Geomonas]MBU5636953.1 hypothetical protein [Geomonas diazotrophica]QWV98853.1 hypothetical protein KP005_06110 [Geomonas nitrogeniifigens]QXE88000.1 hypothetical protein KP003_06260 [Geomonas nitrogeniifigens]